MSASEVSEKGLSETYSASSLDWFRRAFRVQEGFEVRKKWMDDQVAKMDSQEWL